VRAVEVAGAADAELREAAAFYSERAAGLRQAFLDEFERVVQLAIEYPAIGAPYEAGTRRLLFERFPYGVVYRERSPSLLEVVAVMHLHREPGYWRDRL
jgi:plasmid stabilization system protein ParE